ncbi:hypothetical protein [Pandoravirus japonicus]|uniref:Uncharacterized protein n=1 Tax=Pandoravirus japonicus TaxID=2823154 RepID=A0A811BPH0_9VIRU|nr:hypothetical protein [Pandoravirus japonicus]
MKKEKEYLRKKKEKRYNPPSRARRVVKRRSRGRALYLSVILLRRADLKKKKVHYSPSGIIGRLSHDTAGKKRKTFMVKTGPKTRNLA